MNQRARAPAPRTADASQAALLHELHVHQIELEIQNEELRRAQAELAGARDRFVDLYDFAPVGYFTLDAQGVVTEANLTGAAMLGEESQPLLGGYLARFIHARDRERWRRHLRHTLRNDGVQRIELVLQPRSIAPLHGQIDCLRVARADAGVVLRVTLTDITPRKLAEVDRRIAVDAVEAREDERRSVARELHDELGQRLSALKMALASLRQFGGAADSSVGRPLFEVEARRWDFAALRELLEITLPREHSFEDRRVDHEFAGLGMRQMSLSARRVVGKGAAHGLLLLAIRKGAAS